MNIRNIISAVWLNVTRRCNFRCLWCYAKGTKYSSKDDMPLPLAKNLVDLTAQVGAEDIIYVGGEPTFWKHLFELDKFVHNVGLQSTLITNGYKLGNDSYMEEVSKSNIDFISISLKAGNKKQPKFSPRDFRRVTTLLQWDSANVDAAVTNATIKTKFIGSLKRRMLEIKKKHPFFFAYENKDNIIIV